MIVNGVPFELDTSQTDLVKPNPIRIDLKLKAGTLMANSIWWVTLKSLWLIFFGLLMEQAYSQSPTLTLYSLSELNGLTDNRVTSVFQDSNGLMWIGTENGLNQFDGSAFRIFKRRTNDSAGLANNYIHSIVEDSSHHLWIGTQNGLSEYDPEKNSFRSTQCSIPIKNINVMQDVLPDNEGNIWIGTFGGLLKFVPAQKLFIPYVIPSGKLSDNKIFSILIDKKNRFWVGTFNGLWRFYPDSGKFERITFGENNSESIGLIIILKEGSNGKLWMGYWDGGIKWFDPETNRGKTIHQAGLSSIIEGIAEVSNPQGNYDIWCSNLVKIDEHENVTQYALRINPPIANYHVSKLYNSRDGLLWLCTNKGVLIMDPLKQLFHHHYFPQQITHQSISFCQNDQDLYVGGAGQHFLKLYDSTFQVKKAFSLWACTVG